MASLPVEKRIEAFNRALEMKRLGLSDEDIFERLNVANLPIKYDSIQAWMSGKRNPARKLNLIKKFDGDFVELVGLLVGDGTWRRLLDGDSYNTGKVAYGSKDLELASRAGRLMASVLGRENCYRPYWSESSRVYVVECGSKHLVEVLSNVLVGKEAVIWKFRVRFLKGIYDAEGCITVRKRRNHLYPRVYLTNSDLDIINLVRRMLASIGIETTLELNTPSGKRKVILGKPTTTNHDVYNICIGRKAYFMRFARTIGFRITRKQALLQETKDALVGIGRLSRN